MVDFSFSPIKILENGIKVYSDIGDIEISLINRDGTIKKYFTFFSELPLVYKLKLLNSIDLGYIVIEERSGRQIKLRIDDEEKDILINHQLMKNIFAYYFFKQLMKNNKYVPIWQIPIEYFDDECQSFFGMILKLPENIGKQGEIFLIGYSPTKSNAIMCKISPEKAKEILNTYNNLIQEDDEMLWINEIITIIKELSDTKHSRTNRYRLLKAVDFNFMKFFYILTNYGDKAPEYSAIKDILTLIKNIDKNKVNQIIDTIRKSCQKYKDLKSTSSQFVWNDLEKICIYTDLKEDDIKLALLYLIYHKYSKVEKNWISIPESNKVSSRSVERPKKYITTYHKKYSVLGIRRCPKCGGPMYYDSAAITPRTFDGEIRARLICKKCGYTEQD